MSELPLSWALVKIVDVLAANQNGKPFQQGWSPQCEKLPAGSDEWGVLKTTAIQEGDFWEHKNKRLPNSLEPKPHLVVKNGDILMTCAGPRSRCGVTCLVKKSRDKLMMSGKMYRFRCDPDKAYSEYLAYFLHSREAQYKIDRMKTGINDSGLNLTYGRFSELDVPLAPKNEQGRICSKIEELFSELDKGIESLKTACVQLKIYRQAVLKHAFEGKLTAQWREANKDKLDAPEQLLGRIKQARAARYEQQLKEWKSAVKEWEIKGKQGQKPRKPKTRTALRLPSEAEIANLPLLPNGWLWTKVQTLLTEPLANGHSVKDRASGFPVLRLTAIKKEKLDLSEAKNGDWEREDALSYLVREGDFLLARGNGSKQLVGRGGLVPASEHDLAYPDTMIRLRVDPSAIDEAFFSYVWNSRLLRRQIEGEARTTAGIYKINQGHILNFIVPLCSLIEQAVVVERISAVLSAIDGIETEVNKHLGKADMLRQSILKKAFSGQLVAQDPRDEPASVLLGRIRTEREKAEKNNHSKKTKKRTA